MPYLHHLPPLFPCSCPPPPFHPLMPNWDPSTMKSGRDPGLPLTPVVSLRHSNTHTQALAHVCTHTHTHAQRDPGDIIQLKVCGPLLWKNMPDYYYSPGTDTSSSSCLCPSGYPRLTHTRVCVYRHTNGVRTYRSVTKSTSIYLQILKKPPPWLLLKPVKT